MYCEEVPQIIIATLNSYTVFQHDAACRVIARLKKERDEARLLLTQAERQIAYPTASDAAANASALANGKRGSYFLKQFNQTFQ